MFNLKAFLGLTYYTSGLDQFLRHFDKNHTKLSASQRHEIEKSKRISCLRDLPEQSPDKSKFWDKF